ncbi:MarR family winged helix-turn-helix transcriptional regulator [Amycolatopsis carbonis]|uniref:MarR family winged helix-turn-helix transcriptional regulator n=1 Tax=Amycolatopsis carbonis TaxID=715471 RepID=A0A9Y2MV24_9PSEU|nr:MarR family winged helix-turn-helix transcriptional regulator [Amycolatopsis sp. 2-15]WIX76287.1 MarR family winged helix-turn-helix transcriptional regulator [Amycolatopsis sp. 2-15]
MPRPTTAPIGVVLARTAKAAGQAFDQALAAVGGSQPIWQILIALKTHQHTSQRELADAVGIQGATLTHHLNGMETAGLLTRTRDPENRRVHHVELTDHGETTFHRLAEAAVAHDNRMRTGLTDHEIATLATLLGRLAANVTTPAGE